MRGRSSLRRQRGSKRGSAAAGYILLTPAQGILVSMRETGTSFRARWAAVNAVQDVELQRLSVDERFDQLLQLFELRTFVRYDPKADGELAAVRKRWSELRRRHLARRCLSCQTWRPLV